MRILFFFIFIFVSFYAQSSGVLDILKDQDNSFALHKKLKKDIGSLFPSLNKPQAFIKAFESQDFEKALNFWLKSVKSSSFARSSTGQALYSYILFNNGFEVLSLKNLFEKSNPEGINPIVRNLWKVNINEKHPVWDHFFFPVSGQWSGFFPPEILFKLGSKTLYKKDQKYIKYLLALPLNKKTDVFSVEWSFVLSLIREGDMDSATKILAWMIKKTKEQGRKDMIHLTIARLLAGIGETEASLYYYAQVEDLSYYWLFSQEETAWIFFNEKNYGKAYTKASAFRYPGFRREISPYMLLVLTLSQLKNCDYKGVSRSLTDFKMLFSGKKANMEKVLSSGAYGSWIKKLSTFYLSGNPYYGMDYPDLFYHIKKDSFLKNYIKLYQYIRNKNLKRRTVFTSLNEKENKVADELRFKIEKRIQTLLRKELKRMNSVLKQFHLAEVSALYRIHGYHSLLPVNKLNFRSPAAHSVFSNNRVGGGLYFPFSDDEIWLDELSDYKSYPLRGCPKGSYVL